MKVIIISDVKFERIHYEETYVDAIKKENEVEIWDLSYWLKRTSKEEHDICKLNRISSEKEFNDNLRRVASGSKKVILVSNISDVNITLLQPLYGKFNIEMVNLSKELWGSYWLWKANKIYAIKKGMTGVYLRALLEDFPITRKFIAAYRRRNIPNDYAVGPEDYYKERHKKFIFAHHMKYDEFLNVNKETVSLGRYALFMDNALVTHEMYRDVYTDEEKDAYFKALNNYLDKFEEASGIKVIISGYPKVDNKDRFKDRKVIFNDTPRLIRDADVILTNWTTSIVTAILFYKPMIFLEYKPVLYKKISNYNSCIIYLLADMLNLPCDDIESLSGIYKMNAVSTYLEIDKERYNSFISEHILCKGKMDQCNGEILNKFFKDYENGNI